MNQFFQLLEAILRHSPDMSHNLEVSSVSQQGELQKFRPVLLHDNLKVKCNGNVMEFNDIPGMLKVLIIDKVNELMAA